MTSFRCSPDSARARDAVNSLVKTPRSGRIGNIAGGGRQREGIWEMPDNDPSWPMAVMGWKPTRKSRVIWEMSVNVMSCWWE